MSSGISDDLLISLSMNYNNSGSTHRQLIENLRKNSLIRTDRVEHAMRAVDRRDFTAASNPYEDKPHHIGSGATISSPHMHAVALEALEPSLPYGGRALDIGSGSGYVTVAMAILLSRGQHIKSGRAGDGSSGGGGAIAIGIEHAQELVAQSVVNTKKGHASLFLNKHINYVVGDGRHILKAADEVRSLAPFDAIHFGAAVDAVDPEFLNALKVGGRLVAPVRIPDTTNGEQNLTLFHKVADDKIESKVIMRVIYSPLNERPPPSDINKTYKQQLIDVTRKLDALSETVKLAHNAFKDTHGRRPTAVELAADTKLKPLLDEVALLRHRQARLTRLALKDKPTPSTPPPSDSVAAPSASS